MRYAAPLQRSARPGAGPTCSVRRTICRGPQLGRQHQACSPAHPAAKSSHISIFTPPMDDVQPCYSAQHCQKPRSQLISMTRLSPSTIRDAGLKDCQVSMCSATHMQRYWNGPNRHTQGSPDDQGLPHVAKPLSPAHELMLPPPDAGCRSITGDAAAECWLPSAPPAPVEVVRLQGRRAAATPAPLHLQPTQRTAPVAASGPPLAPPAPGANHTGHDVHCLHVFLLSQHRTAATITRPGGFPTQARSPPCLIHLERAMLVCSAPAAVHLLLTCSRSVRWWRSAQPALGGTTSVAAPPSRPAAARAPSCCHSSSASRRCRSSQLCSRAALQNGIQIICRCTGRL